MNSDYNEKDNNSSNNFYSDYVDANSVDNTPKTIEDTNTSGNDFYGNTTSYNSEDNFYNTSSNTNNTNNKTNENNNFYSTLNSSNEKVNEDNFYNTNNDTSESEIEENEPQEEILSEEEIALRKFNRKKRFFKISFTLIILLVVSVISVMVLAELKLIKLPWLEYPEVLNLSQNELMLKYETSFQFSSHIYPSQVSYGKIIYESSNPDVATINPITGYVEAKKNGSTTIKAYLEDYKDVSDTCELVVSNNNVMVESMSVETPNIDLLVGKKYLLKYSYNPSNAGLHYFTYLSTDPSIISVDNKGEVTALSEGKAIVTIYEEASGKSVDQEFTIYPKSAKSSDSLVRTIKVSTSKVNLVVGGAQQVEAKVFPIEVSQSITWTSANPNIATVSNDGLITAVDQGKTQIIATAIDGSNKIVNVTVGEEDVPVKGINIEESNVSIDIGEVKKIAFTIEPSNATNQKVIWTTGDANIASIDQTGNVTGVNKGAVQITATTDDGDFVAKIPVNVSEKRITVNETGLSLSTSKVNINVGGTSYVTAKVTPDNASNKKIIWTSSNNSVATVSNGMIQGKGNGTATITATTENRKISKTVSVTVSSVNITSISLNNSSIKLGVGGEYTLIASISPSNASNKSVSWSTSNSSVASVNGNGLIHANSVGTAVIVARTANGKVAQCTVTVTNENIPVESVKLSSNNFFVKVNGKVGITTIVTPSTATNQKVTLSIDNTSVAEVNSDGTITGKREGVARITATTNNGKKASGYIVVKNNNSPVYYFDGTNIKYWYDNSYKNYAITHIWVNDPYNQFKAEIPDKLGVLASPASLMKKAASKNPGKTLIAINASGLVANWSYSDFYKLDKSWNNTSVSPVVIYEGNVLRDLTKYKLPLTSVKVYGMNKQGNLNDYYVYFENDSEKNRTLAQRMINDGIKYTFAFETTLVTDGDIVSPNLRKDNNIRQSICQVDGHNFLYITNITSNRSKGFSFYSLAQKMVSLGCKKGFNLDGGGSTSIYYVKKGSNSGTKIRAMEGSNGRSIPDMIYFYGD